MRNLKRVLSLALALVMMLGMMVIGANAASTDFADADEITYTEAVEVMAAIGVLKGDGTNFNPTDILTREQAAKIICYMLVGPATAEKLAGTDAFTDVAADRWSAPYIAYCANLGIIAGVGDNAFDPEGQLTGVAFAKMLLVALGNDPVACGYVGGNWATTVAVDAIKAGLDLDGVALAAPLTREQASQMAFTALNRTPDGSTSEYVVFDDTDTDGVPDDGETVYYRGTDAVTALLMQSANSADLALVTSNSGSLADVVFGLKSNETQDVYGRTTKTWTSTKDKTVNVVLADATASYTFTVTTAASVTDGASLVAAINTALNLTGDDALTQTAAVEIVNGVTGFSNLGVGDTVEVYASSTGVVSKVIVIRETVGAASCAATAETTGTYKGLYKWTFGSTAFTYAAKDAYTADAYYVVVENGSTNVALDIKVPTVVSGAKITSADNSAIASATYMTINGDKVLKAGEYDASVTGGTVNFNTAYDIILDSNGNVLYITNPATVVVEDPLETGYAYLLAAEKQVTTTAAADGGLLGSDVAYSWDIAAKAQLAMPNGTSQIVDLTTEITRDDDGVVTALKLNGQNAKNVDLTKDAAPVNLMDTSNLFNGVTWVKYTVQKDGTYTLAAVETKDTDLTKNSATVNIDTVGDKTATSATVWTVYDYNTATKTVSATTVTGIANFVTDDDYEAVCTFSATNGDVITAIDSFKSTSPAPSSNTTYAYYVGQGDYDGTAGAYAQKFYINGEVKNYFTTADVTVVATGNAANDKLEVGMAYVLTVNATSGKVTAAAYKAYGASAAEVTLIDNTFAIIGGSTLYFSDNCKVFNVSTGHTGEADTLSTAVTASGAGDKVSYVVDGDGKLDVIYITTEAN